MKKFLSWKPDPLKPLDLSDAKRWAKEGSCYKLLSPDIERDRQFMTMDISVKQYRPDEKLWLYGIANANIVDRMEERLEPRGCDIISYMKNPQLLAHHSYYHPIGQVVELDIQEDGVKFQAWIGDPSVAELTPMQKEIRSLVAQRILKTVSVGFIPKKVKAPVFGSNGELEEPCVIEDWEMLELSIVAVPCNQASLFEIKDIKSFALGGLKLNDNRQKELDLQNMVVQTLIFDKNVFKQMSDAQAWAKQHDFKFEKVDETESTFRIRHREPDEFDQESFRTIQLTEGVSAVAGKIKSEDATDNKQENMTEESITLLRSLHEVVKRNSEVLDLILKKLDSEPVEETAPKEDDKPKEDEVQKRLIKIEADFGKMAEALKTVVERIFKK
jgi:hypothetical protein